VKKADIFPFHVGKPKFAGNETCQKFTRSETFEKNEKNPTASLSPEMMSKNVPVCLIESKNSDYMHRISSTKNREKNSDQCLPAEDLIQNASLGLDLLFVFRPRCAPSALGE
jgi:hypothetical protein